MTVAEWKEIIKKLLRNTCAGISPLFSKTSNMESAAARRILQECTPDPKGSAAARNKLVPASCDLQIVIPAYNAEAYLVECMESVLSQQSRYSFHIVLVDDGSTDGTPQLCDRYASDPRVTVIHQENRGHAGARNSALENLFGTYVMFVDSDDFLCPGAIEGLLNTAYANDCDLVEGGAYYLIDGKQSIMHSYKEDRLVLQPDRVFHGQPWGKVYKRELLEKVCFPKGYWYEDSVLAFLIYPSANRCYVSSQMCYIHLVNQAGIVRTSKGKPRAIETYYITEMLLRERKELGYPLDAEFYKFMLIQIRLNQQRLEDLDERIQEAAFVLTCELLERYFSPDVMTGAEKNLIRALKTKNFGMFKMCCKFF